MMGDFLRKNVKIFLWIVAVIFIGGIFFFGFGRGGFDINTVAKVNGKKIPYEKFRRQVYQRMQERRMDNEDKEITEGEIKEIKRDVLGSLIQEELICQEAKRYGIKISDSEIINTIHSLPQFQKDGKFHPGLYIQVLRYSLKTEPEKYEEGIKRFLLSQRLRQLILSGIKITEQEIDNGYEKKGLVEAKEEREEFKQKLLNEKRSILFRQWLVGLYQKVKIVSYLEKFKGR